MTTHSRFPIAVAVWAVMALLFFVPATALRANIAPRDLVTGLMTPWRGDSPIKVHAHFQHDAVLHYIPYNWRIAQSPREDGYIGWSGLTRAGSSLQANTMACPGLWTHQLYRVLSLWDGWNCGLIAQLEVH